jgi:DNA polymerase elongation subunit (family B)
MRHTEESKKILADYIALAKSMGKLPTVKESVKFVASERQLYKHYDSFENLKKLALEQCPELQPVENIDLKILVFDIETAPILAHVWDIWDQNVGLNQIIKDWHILSWSAKWYNAPPEEVMYMDQRNVPNIEDETELLKGMWKLLDEADVVITQNGIRFDVPKLNARFAKYNMGPPSSFKHIDTYRIGKKHFGFTSHKLEYMTDLLCKKYKKLSHKKFPGHSMWTECLKNNIEAWKSMEEYNKYDVLSLEELYSILAPWDNTINFNVYHNNLENVCGCGNKVFLRRGYYYTKTACYQRYVCSKCGYELYGGKNLLTKQKKAALFKTTTR